MVVEGKTPLEEGKIKRAFVFFVLFNNGMCSVGLGCKCLTRE